jgi:hypothetical protein
VQSTYTEVFSSRVGCEVWRELSEAERVQLKKSSFELVLVKNWVEFWRWRSKVTEKNWQENNYAVKRLHA